MTPAAKKGRRQSDETKGVEEIGAALFAVMQEAGVSQGTVTCYVKNGDTGEEEYLDRVGVDKLGGDVLHYLKGRWGGGRYHLILKDGDGQYVKNGSLHFTIAGAPKHTAEAQEADRVAELEKRLEEKLGKNGGGEIATIVPLLLELMRENRRPAQTADPIQMAVTLAAAMQNGQTGLLERSDKLLEALVDNRDRNTQDPMKMVQAMLGIAVQLKELGDGGGSGLDKVVGELAAPLGRFFDAQAGAADASHRLAAGAPGPNPPAPEAPQLKAPQNAPAWYPMMSRFLPQLLKWAEDGKDPELRADLVLEELPDRFLGPIHEQLTRGDAFTAEFLEAVPQAQEHREWFGLFFGRILEELDRMWTPAEGEGDDDGAQEEGAPAVSSTDELEEGAELEEAAELEPEASSSSSADVAPESSA